MKKLILTMVAMAIVSMCSAQLYLGGNLSLNSNNGNWEETFSNLTTSGDNPSSFAFGINPLIGYNLSDKLAVGLSFGVGMKTTNDNADIDVFTNRVKTNTFTWRVAPFVRYYCVEFGKFMIFGEAHIGINGASGKSEIKSINATVTREDPVSLGIGLGINPGIAYKLNDHILLEADLNFLSLSYSYSQQKVEYEAPTGIGVLRNSAFGLGLNSYNVLNSGALTLGFSYIF